MLNSQSIRRSLAQLFMGIWALTTAFQAVHEWSHHHADHHADAHVCVHQQVMDSRASDCTHAVGEWRHASCLVCDWEWAPAAPGGVAYSLVFEHGWPELLTIGEPAPGHLQRGAISTTAYRGPPMMG